MSIEQGGRVRKKKHANCGAVDPMRLFSDLESSDEAVRLKALGSLCPCRAGWEIFERHMDVVVRLKKDTSSKVRARALHIFEDAGEIQSSGYPTHRREVVDEMLRKKRSSRFPPDDEELEARRKAKGTALQAGKRRPNKQTNPDH